MTKDVIEPISVSLLTQEDSVFIEFEKGLLKSSFDIGTDFCKFMIGFSSGLIPTYLALMAFIIPKGTNSAIIPQIPNTVPLIIPPILFLISAVIFIGGYMPSIHNVNLNDIDAIKQFYTQAIGEKRFRIISGSVFFSLALSFLFINIILILSRM